MNSSATPERYIACYNIILDLGKAQGPAGLDRFALAEGGICRHMLQVSSSACVLTIQVQWIGISIEAKMVLHSMPWGVHWYTGGSDQP